MEIKEYNLSFFVWFIKLVLIIKSESLIVNIEIVMSALLCTWTPTLLKTLFTRQAIPKQEQRVTQWQVDMLSDLVGISSILVSWIPTTWIHLLSRELQYLMKWPAKHPYTAMAKVLCILPISFWGFLIRVISLCERLHGVFHHVLMEDKLMSQK